MSAQPKTPEGRAQELLLASGAQSWEDVSAISHAHRGVQEFVIKSQLELILETKQIPLDTDICCPLQEYFFHLELGAKFLHLTKYKKFKPSEIATAIQAGECLFIIALIIRAMLPSVASNSASPPQGKREFDYASSSSAAHAAVEELVRKGTVYCDKETIKDSIYTVIKEEVIFLSEEMEGVLRAYLAEPEDVIKASKRKLDPGPQS
jgi:hypothetical protein